MITLMAVSVIETRMHSTSSVDYNLKFNCELIEPEQLNIPAVVLYISVTSNDCYQIQINSNLSGLL